MKKFAVIDAQTGKATAFYSEDVHGARMILLENENGELEPVDNPKCLIPADAVEISDYAWRNYLDRQPYCHFDARGSVVLDSLPDADRVAAIKAAAYRVIVGRCAEWRQRNMIARDGELQHIKNGTYLQADGAFAPARDWTAAEKAEMAAMRDVWDWVKAVRKASDDAEATPGMTADQIVWPA